MGKRKGKHPEKALTAVAVSKAKKPGRYADGGGLYLVVETSGAKRWMLRTTVMGRRTDIGLGGVLDVTLADARDEATRMRRIAKDGGDPVAERKRAKGIPTFEAAAKEVHAYRSKAWRNAKHGNQWINTLTTYAFPHIGQRKVDKVSGNDVMRVLTPIWHEKPETARRVRQRIHAVLDWAAAQGYRSGENPAAAVRIGLGRQTDQKAQKHHAAMPYDEVPEFVRIIHASDSGEVTKLAFEFLVLTAARTGEILGATLEEFDLEAATWTVPAERMKAGITHAVPLPARCVEIVKRAIELGDGGGYLFPGNRKGKPLSNMTFLQFMRRQGIPYVPHGFRSSFRDWAAERTHFPREVVEAALAHLVESKVERAYRRSDLFDRRGKLMATWERYVAADDKKIFPLGKHRTGIETAG